MRRVVFPFGNLRHSRRASGENIHCEKQRRRADRQHNNRRNRHRPEPNRGEFARHGNADEKNTNHRAPRP